MISQKVKGLYWFATSPLSIVNLCYQKAVHRLRQDDSVTFLNLGSGRHYIEGFVNVDVNLFLPKDLWLDVRFGLPFPDDSVQAIYICHMLEHFDFKAVLRILNHCRRVLAAGGGVRIAVPSLEKAIQAFNRQDAEWFSSWPDKYGSLGGRFNNFLLCRDQHRLMFDFSFVEEALNAAGFSSVEAQPYGVSRVFPPGVLPRMEPEQDREYHERSLIVEALKPA